MAAVGRVKAFGEDDDLGACCGGFEDFGARGGEVGGFVRAGGELDECELHRLAEEFGRHIVYEGSMISWL